MEEVNKITLDPEDVAELTVTWVIHNDLMGENYLSKAQQEDLRKRVAAAKLAQELLQYVKWSPPRRINGTFCDVTIGTLKVIKP